MDETFYLTNIAPQVGEGFNRHCAQTRSLTSTDRTWTGPGSRTLLGGRPSCSMCVPLAVSWLSLEGRLHLHDPTLQVASLVCYANVRRPREEGARREVARQLRGHRPAVACAVHLRPDALCQGHSRHRRIRFQPSPRCLRPAQRADPRPHAARELRHARCVRPCPAPLTPSVEAVEIASGLTLFGEDLKRSAMPLCSPTRRCEIVQRYFDESGNLLSAPPKGVKTKGLPEVDAAAA